MSNFSDKTIVMLATVPWSDAWQRQQELARQFARSNRVLYVEPLGMRNYGPVQLVRKLGRLLARWRKPMYQHTLEPLVAAKIEHVKLTFVPWHDIGWLNRLNGRWLARQLRAKLPGNMSDVVLWCCNPADTVVALVDELAAPNGATVVYDVAMRFAKRHDAPTYVARSQAELARRADHIFYDNRASLDDLPAEVRGKAHFVPQGLHEQFFKAANGQHPALVGIPHPRVGFVGAGHDAFDAAAVRAVVDELPSAHVVLAGIYSKRDPRLDHPRVHYVGAVPLSELPSLMAGLDVGTIPYKVNAYTAGVFPTKFFEYLAAGLPVVSTELPELRRYQERVTFASSATFASAVAQAAKHGRTTPDTGYLREQSWERRFADITAALMQVTAPQA